MVLIIIVAIAVLIVAIIVARNVARKNALLAKAEQGDVQAQFAVYQAYKAKRAKSDEAIRYLEKSAENGFVEAQIELGRKLVYGDGIEKDPAKAIDWFNKAVEQQSADAHYYLGLCYKSGDGVQKSVEKAMDSFERAAKGGHGDAYYEKGLLCLDQDGDETGNRIKAIMCWENALDNDSKKLSEAMGFGEIDKDKKLKNAIGPSVKYCCIWLLALGYGLKNCGSVHTSGDHRYASIEVLENGNGVGEIKVGTYGPGSEEGFSDARRLRWNHIENNRLENGKLCHMIHLDAYCILMESTVPRTECPPRWLILCAQKFKQDKYEVKYPDWVSEGENPCPDAVEYVNTAFKYD